MKKLLNFILYVFAGIGFILTGGYFAVRFGLTNEAGIIDNQRNSFVLNANPGGSSSATQIPFGRPAWAKTKEWEALQEAILRDQVDIKKAAQLMDIEPRLLVSILMVEQLRLFTDNRELFKTVFAPLKILGTQSQFSWGVMGIKPETAIQAENYLHDPSSTFYPGDRYQHVLDFNTSKQDDERFQRLVNENDRFYSYLYAAVIVKELETQWERAGFGISSMPAIVSTLYNIGFAHSVPNNNPKSGGATITIGTNTYSFGSLSLDFYDSSELLDVFPRR